MPLGIATATVSARTKEGTVSVQAGSIEFVVPPATLDSKFFGLAWSPDGGTTYYPWTDNDGLRVKFSPSIVGALRVGAEAHQWTHVKVETESTERYDRVFTFVLEGAAGGAGLTLSLDTNDYPIAYIRSAGVAEDVVPPLRIGEAIYDQHLGAYIKQYTDFSGLLGEQTADLSSDRIGHLLYPVAAPSLDGSMGYLAGPPLYTARASPNPVIATTKAVVPTSIGCSSDIAGDGFPRAFLAMGNEVWRTEGVAGSPVITNGTTIGDPLIRDTVTATITFDKTSNPDEITAASGLDVFVAGDRIIVVDSVSNDGVYTVVAAIATKITLGNDVLVQDEGPTASVIIKTGTIPGATQITSIASFPYYSPGSHTGSKSLLITGATAAATNIDIYQSLDGTTIEKVGTTQGYGATVQYAEQATALEGGVGAFQAVYGVLPIFATRDNIIWARGTNINAGYLHLPIYYHAGKIQFLAPSFDDMWGLGIWYMAGSKLYNMTFPSLGSLHSLMGSTPQLPPLTCGCMYMRKACVTDGMNVWLVEGDTARWIGIPPGIIPTYAAAATRLEVQSLTPAGHLLIAGIKAYDGTNYYIYFLAYDDDSRQWRAILQITTTTNEPEVHGAFLGPLSAPADVSAKHLWLSYSYGGNSYALTVHLPRGFVGASGGDDTFTGGQTMLPAFDGGDPEHDGPLVQFSVEAELFEAHAGHKITTLVRGDNLPTDPTYKQTDVSFTGAADGVGRVTKTWTPAAGGLNFTDLYVAFITGVNTATSHPIIHSIKYVWRKRRDTRLLYEFLVDTQKWMRENSKNVKQLLAQLATSRDKNVLVAAYVDRSSGVEESIIGTAAAPIYVEILPFTTESPGSLAAEAIGYTLVRLEEPV